MCKTYLVQNQALDQARIIIYKHTITIKLKIREYKIDVAEIQTPNI